jgi:hypothetical protein
MFGENTKLAIIEIFAFRNKEFFHIHDTENWKYFTTNSVEVQIPEMEIVW